MRKQHDEEEEEEELADELWGLRALQKQELNKVFPSPPEHKRKRWGHMTPEVCRFDLISCSLICFD